MQALFSVYKEFWYFKPLYQEDPSSSGGLISSLLQFLRLKEAPLKRSSGDLLTLADIRARGDVREVACVIPVSTDILHVPNIRWFKDGLPVRQCLLNCSSCFREMLPGQRSNDTLRHFCLLGGFK